MNMALEDDGLRLYKMSNDASTDFTATMSAHDCGWIEVSRFLVSRFLSWRTEDKRQKTEDGGCRLRSAIQPGPLSFVLCLLSFVLPMTHHLQFT